VLASDTRHSVSPFGDKGARHHYGASKIEIDPTGQIAIACAGDMSTARQVAARIIAEFMQFPLLEREYRIREIGISVGGFDAECLIAFSDSRLYSFQSANKTTQCYEVFDYAFAGDRFNAANFWATRYYKRLPIKRLLQLAAVVIFEAYRLNPDVVKGLEMVYWNGTKYYRIPREENRAWAARIEMWDKQIGRFILGYGKDSI
jgi:hypothetical protein